MRLLFALCFAYLVFAGSPSFAELETESSRFGEIEIRIRASEAKIPAPVAVRMDPDVCGKTRIPELIRLGPKNELADVFAWIEGPNTLTWPPFSDDAADGPSIELKNCESNPRTVIARPKENIRFYNRDPILHSVRAEGTKNYPVFRAHPPQLTVTTIRLEHPEIVPITSDLHPWMHSFVAIAPHQNYAISNSSGAAKISKIPQGSYRVKLWHPVLGEYIFPQEVDVSGKKISLSLDWKSIQP